MSGFLRDQSPLPPYTSLGGVDSEVFQHEATRLLPKLMDRFLDIDSIWTEPLAQTAESRFRSIASTAIDSLDHKPLTGSLLKPLHHFRFQRDLSR
jgi:hypothetical protein